MNILISLFFEFFKTGLFSVGGGLATLPFLKEMSVNTGWFTYNDLSNLVAVSESTPGPLGVNMATYVGYVTSGILGSIVGPLGLICPSIVIIIIISNVLNRFKDSKYVQYIFYGLRAASTALIAAAGIEIAKFAMIKSDISNIFNDFIGSISWASLIIGVVVYITFTKFKKHPIVYIIASAVVGIIFQI